MATAHMDPPGIVGQVLIKQSILEAIQRGTVRTVFRRRDRLAVRAGSIYKTAVGLVAIDAVDAVELSTLTAQDAESAGYGSLGLLLEDLQRWPGSSVFRVRVRYAGPDPRVALRNRDQLTPAELRDVLDRLDGLDRRAAPGGWTRAYLMLIRDQPGVLAAHLAGSIGLPTLLFKRRVRQLKELGLTESLEVGYRLAPRGRTVLAGIEDASVHA
jgi:hypothetical protein